MRVEDDVDPGAAPLDGEPGRRRVPDPLLLPGLGALVAGAPEGDAQSGGAAVGLLLLAGALDDCGLGDCGSGGFVL
ncbi:MAG TPA: hypothetical protein VLJ85_05825 [Geodermatophilus sp.]|nr:hypothetical protein [Geodermatophilus sp.]